MIRDLRTSLIVAAGVLLAAWVLWRWYAPEPPITPSTYVTAAPTRPALPKTEIPAPMVKALPKTAASKKLDLPAEIAADPAQQILDAVTVPPTKGGATAIAVLDTRSGETRTIVREKPRPLFGFEKGGAAGIRYGASNDGTAVALFVRQDVARVGNLYLSGYAEAGRDARAMVEVSYRW